MSTATASYGVYALIDPRHLGRALTANEPSQREYDLLALTFGGRDLAISAVGVLGRSPHATTAAMLVRIACDVSDGLILAARAEDDATRQKVLGATFGWAALNTLALLHDRRVARLASRSRPAL